MRTMLVIFFISTGPLDHCIVVVISLFGGNLGLRHFAIRAATAATGTAFLFGEEGLMQIEHRTQ